MKMKGLALAVVVCSPVSLALLTSVVPQIGLMLLGLAFLGVISGAVPLIGTLLAVGGLLKLLPTGPQGLGDLLLA